MGLRRDPTRRSLAASRSSYLETSISKKGDFEEARINFPVGITRWCVTQKGARVNAESPPSQGRHSVSTTIDRNAKGNALAGPLVSHESTTRRKKQSARNGTAGTLRNGFQVSRGPGEFRKPQAGSGKPGSGEHAGRASLGPPPHAPAPTRRNSETTFAGKLKSGLT